MRTNLSLLQKERIHLLDEWSSAKGNDKVKLLVRIMDIDEQLEIDQKKDVRPNRKKVG